MIRIKQVATRKVVVCWETGEDFGFLTLIQELIKLRNTDKEEIIGLKEEII